MMYGVRYDAMVIILSLQITFRVLCESRAYFVLQFQIKPILWDGKEQFNSRKECENDDTNVRVRE